MNFNQLLDKVFNGEKPTVQELVELLKVRGFEQMALLAAADCIRRQVVGDGIHLRALVEFSNFCSKNCLYCGLRRDNCNVKRYRMTPEEVIETAQLVKKAGYFSIVLQAGEDAWWTIEKLATVIKTIKTTTNLAITLSIGAKSFDEYKILKQAGADRFLMRHETIDGKLYAYLHPGDTLDKRIEDILSIKKAGFQVGAGMMVGLPGQTLDSLAKDILFLDEIAADMVGIGPFIANPDTPLADNNSGTLELTLNCLALTRLVVRDIHMPSTTALGTIHPLGRRLGLIAGCNVIMPVFTPLDYTAKYNIYPNKVSLGHKDDLSQNIKTLATALGRFIAQGHGHSIRKN